MPVDRPGRSHAPRETTAIRGEGRPPPALGSLAEMWAALRVAAAWGDLDADSFAAADAKLDRVAAMTWRPLHARR